ncbi:pentatricopeptide repeat-containing protein At1g05750, chloroplastic-like [Pistacia vera]|uniref:pentatricopeptide repeat-containing protein At1g05750, chloroplastic-like n=1 Tax=Pistacia vera TaxID=55513 RepID=UPI001262B0E9|nr:pentatricopeptide repeat-containing protein At1g05750, chloroplastic-like [Pistacia vera]
MRLSGVSPNHITFVSLLSGCADFPSESSSFGFLIHGLVCKLGLDKNNVKVGTALVQMYAKFGRMDLANMVFDGMGMRNSFSWNTMIDGYMKNGDIERAVKLFDEMPVRDTVSWTALVNGLVKRGYVEEALECFREMQMSGVELDYVAIIAVLAACADIGTLGLGLWVHCFFLKQDFKDNVRVSNSLIDVYSRCGCIEFARQVFQGMQKRTLVSWNSIIVGLAVNGFAEETLEHFNLMQEEGFKPDAVSFTGALTACSHAGLIDNGLQYFDIMQKAYRISPGIEHYGCLVDLYSRAGRLEDALNVIENMPMKPNEVVFGSLLAACRSRGDVMLAERLMKYLVDLDPGVDSNYVLLANMYAAIGRWDGASKIRRTMKGLGIQKKPGISSIEIGSSIHEFVAGDKSHKETEHIYAMLDLLSFDLRLYGYVPEPVARELYEND